MKKSVQLLLGIVVVATGLLLARTAYASHNCGSTCNQFTQEGVCTHGCYAGGNPNPDYRDTNDSQYTNTNSAPAKKGTDGGNKQVAEETVAAFENGQDYVVDEEIHNTTSAQEAAQVNPGSYSSAPVATDPGDPARDCTGDTCITFTCTKCGSDRRCETGIGENPQYSVGGAPGACAQVDRKTANGWEVVSLCDPSCSGGTTSYTTPSYTTPSSHPPEQSLACDAITKSIEKPTLNQAVTFTCKGSFSSDNPVYEFRYKVDGGEYTTVAGVRSSDKKQATADITVNKLGAWEVQCRVCTNDSKSHCTDWGKR